MSTVPHPDEAAFLAAIGEQPADALPRLIFADWLDEHGRADEAAWLRADVRLAQAYPDTDPDDLLAIKDLKPPAGVPSLWLARSLGDVTRVLGAMLLGLGRFLGPALRAFVTGLPHRPRGSEADAA
jgi:uncharacterized protein (TIGR02996 family)